MADLVTHLASALIPKGITGGRHVGPFTIGAVLPDLGARLPSMLLDRLDEHGVPLPRYLMHPWTVLHMPVGILCACGLLTLLFPERDRKPVFGWLLAGSALHMGIDLLQDHHGQGYWLLFPFTLWRFELGWIGSEATVPLAPWFAAITVLVWGIRWAGVKDRRKSTEVAAATDTSPTDERR